MKVKLAWKTQEDGADILFVGKAVIGEVRFSSWALKKFIAHCRLPYPALMSDYKRTRASAKRAIERTALKWFKLAGIDCEVEK